MAEVRIRRSTGKRRWFQFSFRTLMVSVVCLAAALSWYHSEGRRAAEGILRVQMLGGSTKLEELPSAGWQRWMLGQKHFVRAREVKLGNRGVSDSDLSNIRDLVGVRRLDLHNNPGITDAGLGSISRFREIEQLILSGTSVSDKGLANLRALTDLHTLKLSNTDVTGRGLVNLQHLPNLRDVSLANTDFSDATMRSLSTLPSLERVRLFGSRLTPAGKAELTKMSNLEDLTLHHFANEDLVFLKELPKLRALACKRGITDEGLQHLSGLHHIETLDLTCDEFTDRGLKHIASMRGLKKLWVWSGDFSDDGLRHISNMKQLQWLHLYESFDKRTGKITDQGLRYLHRLKTLQYIDINQSSHLTKEGVDELRAAFPMARVKLYPPKER